MTVLVVAADRLTVKTAWVAVVPTQTVTSPTEIVETTAAVTGGDRLGRRIDIAEEDGGGAGVGRVRPTQDISESSSGSLAGDRGGDLVARRRGVDTEFQRFSPVDGSLRSRSRRLLKIRA